MDESGSGRKNFPHTMASKPTGYDADKEQIGFDAGPLTPQINAITHLKGEVDPEQATGPLIGYCFMTGFMCAFIPLW